MPLNNLQAIKAYNLIYIYIYIYIYKIYIRILLKDSLAVGFICLTIFLTVFHGNRSVGLVEFNIPSLTIPVCGLYDIFKQTNYHIIIVNRL